MAGNDRGVNAPMSTRPPDVRLTCEVAISDAALRVRFTVTNVSAEEIHVFDNAGRSPEADIVCDGGDGALHMLVGVPPLPPFPCYWKYHPRTTSLIPGESVSRELVAPIPVREVGRYYPTVYAEHVPVTIERVSLRLDFLRASKVSVTSYPDEPRGEVESVWRAAPMPCPVELWRRRDPFDRI